MSSGAAAVTGKLAERSLSVTLDAAAAKLVAMHGDWAFFTVLLLFAVGALRFDLMWRDRGTERPLASKRRYGVVALAIFGQWVLWSTASRGGALVYRRGVGTRGGERGIIDERR